MKQAPHSGFLPLEGLMSYLHSHGFIVGVDTYVQVNQLLRLHNRRGASLAALRQSLGPLLAKTPQQQAAFRDLFDQYVSRYEYVPPVPPPPPLSPWQALWLRYRLPLIWWSIILGGVWVSWLVLLSMRGIKADFGYLQEQLSYTIWFEDESEVFEFAPLVRDSVVESSWDFGDGHQGQGKLTSHRYDAPGIYTVTLRSQSRHGTDSVQWSIYVQEVFKVNIQTGEESQPYTFRANLIPLIPTQVLASAQLISHVAQHEQEIRRTYQAEQTYLWEFGDGDSAFEAVVNHTYEIDSLHLDTMGSYSGHLELTHRLVDSLSGAIYWEFSGKDYFDIDPRTKPQSKFEKILENISKIQNPVSNPDNPMWALRDFLLQYWEFLLGGLIGLGAILYEGWRWYQQRSVLKPEGHKKPPMRQSLTFDRPEANLFRSSAFELAFRLMRRTPPKTDTQLDLPDTLKHTIRQGGLPHFIYKTRSQAAQYLFLIDQRSHQDQVARYYGELVRELSQRDLSIEAFYFDTYPDLCWRDRSKPETELSISQLLTDYSHYHLVIVGDGAGYLSEENQAWAQLIGLWSKRTLLSTLPTEDWGAAETQLMPLLPIVPAQAAGLQSLAELHLGAEAHSVREWKQALPEVGAPNLQGARTMAELQHYLGPKGFQWLCACATYPAMYWELSLDFGKMLYGEVNAAFVESLDRLLRLAPFRTGKFPNQLRLELLAEIDPDWAEQVREHLIQVISQPRNQAPLQSYARQHQETTLAIYRYLNSSRSEADLKALQAALPVHIQEIKDLVSIQTLQEIRRNPGVIVLPRWFYKGRMPLFGTRFRVRLLLYLIPLFILGVIKWGLAPDTPRTLVIESNIKLLASRHFFGSVSAASEQGKIAIPYIGPSYHFFTPLGQSDDGAMYTVAPDQWPNSAHFSYEPYGYGLNGSPYGYVFNDTPFVNRVENAGNYDFSQLKMLVFQGDEDSASVLQDLQLIAPSRNKLGIYTNNEPYLMERIRDSLLERVSPFALIVAPTFFTPETFGKLTDLELLLLPILGTQDTAILTQLQKLPALSTLWLSLEEYDESLDLSPLANLPHLKTLVLGPVKNHQLTQIGKLSQIEHLNLSQGSPNDRIDLRLISELTQLKSLILNNGYVSNLEATRDFRNLRYLSTPVGFTQADFTRIIELHPQLVYVEIMDCDSIFDFTPLLNLPHLKGIHAVSDVPIDLSPLTHLQPLDYLYLGEILYDDSTQQDVIAQIRQNMPDTVFAIVEPVCLGSGWVLLLIPLIGLVFFLRKPRRIRFRYAR